MADVINDWSWLVLAVIGVVGALLSYIVNAYYQRGLERNKIQYETKNRAFKDLTEAGRRLMSVTEALRTVAFRLNDSQYEPIEAIMVGAIIAQELERSMGSDLSSSILLGLESRFIMSQDPKSANHPQDGAYKDDVLEAGDKIDLLYGLLFNHYYERLAVAAESALIIMEDSDEFSNSVTEFTLYSRQLFQDQRKALRVFAANLAKDSRSGASSEYTPDEKLGKMWNRVLDTMSEDLYQTL